MKEFSGKVAVITGAASGIGRGLADRCAEEGMKVVLADLDEEGLAQAESELQATGATTLDRTDRRVQGGRRRGLGSKDLGCLWGCPSAVQQCGASVPVDPCGKFPLLNGSG